MSDRIKVLSVASMFPNPRMPVHAMFVKQRLDALAVRVDLVLVSPIPWFPGQWLLARYRNRHLVPPSTDANAYPTRFPRFFSFPSILKPLDAVFMAMAVARELRRLRPWRPQVIDCHLAFPDGYAGFLLKHWLKIPYVVTLRGHDINDLHRFPMRFRQVLTALHGSAAYFSVAQALLDAAWQAGAPRNKGFLSPNGVDGTRFEPLPRDRARREIGVPPEGRYLLTVSHLVPRKGVDIIIEALARLRSRGESDQNYQNYQDLRLIVVGKGGEEGDCEAELRAQAQRLGVAQAIVWAGAVENTRLKGYYSAADIFCLASEKEGRPNVVLEALACGTPCIATATWGTPELLPSEDLGLLVQERTPAAFTAAIENALAKTWDRNTIRTFAERFTWSGTAEAVAETLVGVASVSF